MLTAKQERAAILCAEDEISDIDIARQCGISPAGLYKWKAKPEFGAAVRSHIDRLATELSRYAIARKDRRMAAYQDRWDRLRDVIAARAANPDVPADQGGDTGLVVRQIELDRDGAEHEVFAVDTGTLTAQLALEKQAAIEANQWTERKDVTSGGDSLTRRYLGIDLDAI